MHARFLVRFLLVGHYIDVAAQYLCAKTALNITGGGSSITGSFYESQGHLYAANRSAYNVKVNIHYVLANSMWGMQHIMRPIHMGDPVAFVAVDALLPVEELQLHPELQIIPILMSTLAIIYNLPGVVNLTLDIRILPDIYMGKIQYWNDDKIVKDNKYLTLPYQKILKVARGEPSGETDMFTRTLSVVSKEWSDKYGSFMDPNFVDLKCCNSQNWPNNTIDYYGNTVTGMIGLVSSIPYTLAYAALPNVRAWGVPVAGLRNTAGTVTYPTVASTRAAIRYRKTHVNNLTVQDGYSLVNIPTIDAYPLIAFSYIIVNKSMDAYITCCAMRELIGYISWILDNQETVWEDYNLVSLESSDLVGLRNLYLRGFTCNGLPVLEAYFNSMTVGHTIPLSMLLLIVFSCAVTTLVATGLLLRYYWNVRLNDSIWIIPAIDLFPERESRASSAVSFSSVHKNVDQRHHRTAKRIFEPEQISQKYGTVGGNLQGFGKVNLSPLNIKDNPRRWNKMCKMKAGMMKKTIVHPNVLNFLGVICPNNIPTVYAVHEFCSRGTLHYVLLHAKFTITEPIKCHLCENVAAGVEYLHRKVIFICNLNSLTCYVDSTWTVKVSNWTYAQLHVTHPFQSAECEVASNYNSMIAWLYVDPRVAKDKICDAAADSYSYGLLLHEIFRQQLPYATEVAEGSSFKEIIESKLHDGGDTPPHAMDGSAPTFIIDLIIQCLKLDYKSRPSFKQIHKELKEKTPVGLMDLLMQAIDDHMQLLDQKVEIQTASLSALTKRMETLLCDILPPQIATKLLANEKVDPEYFKCVTVAFSDIVGFTSISAMSTPLQVIQFLNGLYTMFDKTIKEFDVYKVDTIGDAYMVCSGLPQQNGLRHACEIAKLSLQLVKNCHQYKIYHLPKKKLEIRMGINSGPVTAGEKQRVGRGPVSPNNRQHFLLTMDLISSGGSYSNGLPEEFNH